MDPIAFRPITPADEPFLRQVYTSTRIEELAAVPWTPEQKEAFCRMQFDAQHNHYQKFYPKASYDIIEREATDVGRLYVDRTETEILIVDISLLPEFRGAGLGGRILRDLQAEAQTARKTLTIYVEKFNPARRLYDRLGFQPTKDEGVYDRMEWQPGSESLD
jgi:GNAT superfamily N-acetyltransferase